MQLTSIIQKILRRPFFKGQHRIFNLLFKRNLLNIGEVVVNPLSGNFKINCKTTTWIGASIVFMGEYEPYLKSVFKQHISNGDTVLDVGANIGFHTLYFADLAGPTGKVISFEPIPSNFAALSQNIALNNFKNIHPKPIALGNKNEQINIVASTTSSNPGSFNLFETGGDVVIDCRIGDEVINEDRIDLIKIDVEGYESFVLEGLVKTIEKHSPKIIFEYDKNYQLKTGLPADHISALLASLNYEFYEINQNGLIKIKDFSHLSSSDVLAIHKA